MSYDKMVDLKLFSINKVDLVLINNNVILS